ncbi:hypothetical protein V6N12_070961 [Hibiscus sabdariffa]|uniref:Uncharacterized protein n=1 Tax=Hibiscus sabdariffa TaxID=183260 RepID=A0ABR2FID8_9ROSI
MTKKQRISCKRESGKLLIRSSLGASKTGEYLGCFEESVGWLVSFHVNEDDVLGSWPKPNSKNQCFAPGKQDLPDLPFCINLRTETREVQRRSFTVVSM